MGFFVESNEILLTTKIVRKITLVGNYGKLFLSVNVVGAVSWVPRYFRFVSLKNVLRIRFFQPMILLFTSVNQNYVEISKLKYTKSERLIIDQWFPTFPLLVIHPILPKSFTFRPLSSH